MNPSLRTRLIAAAVVATLSSPLLADVRLAPAFSSHMVLQRDVTIPLSGTTAANAPVEALVDGKPTASGKADADGRFRLELPALAAPGPYRIEVRSGPDTTSLDDVLAGEVWLCSGQSNMELPTTRAANPDQEVAEANHPTIRLLHIPNTATDGPTDKINAKWEACSPATVGSFSAAGYYFGRHLNRELNVPIGLIESAWGGTPAESWTPLEKLKQRADLPKANQMAMNVDASRLPDAAARFDVALVQWMEQTGHTDPGVSDEAKAWASPDVEAAGWKPLPMPTDIVKHGVPSGSTTWLRREIDVPAESAGKPLTLGLGIIDDFDTTFFNGTQVGATTHATPKWWSAQRKYAVPGELVKAGRNVIAVRVVDLDGPAGLSGPAGALRATPDGSAPIPLTGPWQLRVERAFEPKPGQQPLRPLAPYKLDSAWTPGTLYSGMIAPLGDLPIRGVTWYQGEANATRYEEYAPLLTTLIGSWREQFGARTPFYIVGLANWRNPTADPNAFSDWAGVREAQRQVSRTVDHTAMSVTIDIGETIDIHPKNKQEVGRRLALIALADAYGKRLVSRGPTLKGAAFEGGHVAVSFDHVGGGLEAHGEKLASFAVAGADGKFVWADARIDGDRVIVSSPDVPQPTKVRYAWADNPTASLFNKEGLPAEPFEAAK